MPDLSNSFAARLLRESRRITFLPTRDERAAAIAAIEDEELRKWVTFHVDENLRRLRGCLREALAHPEPLAAVNRYPVGFREFLRAAICKRQGFTPETALIYCQNHPLPLRAVDLFPEDWRPALRDHLGGR